MKKRTKKNIMANKAKIGIVVENIKPIKPIVEQKLRLKPKSKG